MEVVGERSEPLGTRWWRGQKTLELRKMDNERRRCMEEGWEHKGDGQVSGSRTPRWGWEEVAEEGGVIRIIVKKKEKLTGSQNLRPNKDHLRYDKLGNQCKPCSLL